MCELGHLLEKNQQWSQQCVAQDSEFFHRLAAQQNPEYLWIGCSDSRVPANDIVGLAPGELFVHRNIANAVQATDYNCLSVLQYAIEVLQVKHIIVCGHYGCGGVQAAMDNNEYGVVDNWLRQVKDVYVKNQQEIHQLRFRDQKLNRLCELNVIEQVNNLAKTKVIQHAWQRGQALSIHGWIYSICNGQINDLKVSCNNNLHLDPAYRLLPKVGQNTPPLNPNLACSLVETK